MNPKLQVLRKSDFGQLDVRDKTAFVKGGLEAVVASKWVFGVRKNTMVVHGVSLRNKKLGISTSFHISDLRLYLCPCDVSELQVLVYNIAHLLSERVLDILRRFLDKFDAVGL